MFIPALFARIGQFLSRPAFVSADTARCVCRRGTLCFFSGAEADGAGAFQPDGLGVELLGGSPHVGGLDSLIK